MTRYEIINHLIEHHGYKSYLEIGVNTGDCFTRIRCLRKTSVDPAPKSDHTSHKMTSDEFFAELDAEDLFDLIFIDGLHLEAQVDTDIANSLRHLSPGGSIVLHDCNPPTELHAGEIIVYEPPTSGAWNGTVYRSLIKIRLERTDVSLLTVDSDWGVGILTRGPSQVLETGGEDAMTWGFFDLHRREILQLISPEEFKHAHPIPTPVFSASRTDARLNVGPPCPFHVLEAAVGYGALGCQSQLGYDNLTATNFLRCRWVLSAHASSRLLIEVTAQVSVLGFLNGSAMYCPAAEFFADGEPLGKVGAAFDVTKCVVLSIGQHVLEIRAASGNNVCHTMWGFDADPTLLAPPKFYATVGAICKDENDYLEEWIRHHLSTGVEHFYLLDNGSEKPLRETVQELKLADRVTVEDYPDHGICTQTDAYLYLCKKFASECFWMAIIDIDEFIVPKLSPSLPKVLMAYEEFGSVMARWVMFSADGHESKPARQLGSYKSSYVDPHTKVIVQPRFVSGFPNPHRASLMAGRRAVSEHFDNDSSTQYLQINHYWTRSRAEWAEKIARGTLVPGFKRSWADFDGHSKRCIYRDDAIEQYWKRSQESPTTDEKTPVIGFIHLAAVNHWQAILRSQIEKCQRSGLWDRTRVIYLGIVGAGTEILKELEPLPEKISVLFCDPDITRYEFPTLAALQQECDSDELKYVWYVHSKGVVNQFEGQQAWRSRMEGFVLIHFELAVGKLAEGYYAAGADATPDARWNIAGNFWWARSDHIKTLPRVSSLNWANRWAAEGWICTQGLTGLYLHDYGETIFDGFEILTDKVKAGAVTTNGYHGWTRLPVLVGKHFSHLDHCISAHAPSGLEIMFTKQAKVFGFVSGSGEATGWKLEFLVDGKSVGMKTGCNDCTEQEVIEPGLHTLVVRLVEGEHWGAHSCWGISF